MRLLALINTNWENLQITKHKSVRALFCSPDWFVLCDLQIFSASVYHLEQSHARSLFLFPTVFGITLIPFLDGTKDSAAVQSILCLRFLDHLSHWPFARGRTNRANFWQRKVITNFSATMVTNWEWRNEEYEVWARATMQTKVRTLGSGKVWTHHQFQRY